MKPEIWGHRGAYAYAPENTPVSFQLAADMGADGVEFDIQLSKDGEVVVIHDETVDRTSDGHGYVKDYSLSQLKKMNFNKRGITPPFFMEIPTLDETLSLLKSTKLKINIEIKTGIVFYEGLEQKALETVERYKLSDRVVWSSFNHYSVNRIKQLDSNAQTALLCGGGILVTAEQCKKIGDSAIHLGLHQLEYPGLMEDCRKQGVLVRVWTVNEIKDMQYAYGKGVDGIFTNFIDRAKDAAKH